MFFNVKLCPSPVNTKVFSVVFLVEFSRRVSAVNANKNVELFLQTENFLFFIFDSNFSGQQTLSFRKKIKLITMR